MMGVEEVDGAAAGEDEDMDDRSNVNGSCDMMREL
jgi:hypothetical protein